MSTLTAPVSLGELIDRITILHIKSRRLVAPAKRRASQRDLQRLRALAAPYASARLSGLERRLLVINSALWECEERSRRGARTGGGDAAYLLKRIRTMNDLRHRVKHAISRLAADGQFEFKSYV